MAAESNAVNPIGYAWRIVVIASVYLVAMMASGALVTAAGMRFPELPGQTFSPALHLVAALLLAGVLAALARGVRGSGTARWLVLAMFTYVSYGLNNQIEAAVFTTIGGTWTLLVFWVIPCLAVCGAAVLLVQTRSQAGPMGTVFGARPVAEWWWRALLAWLAFPVIYFLFGTMVLPFVFEAYRQGQFGLVIPRQGIVMTAVSVRSLLFLAATVPILLRWLGSRRGLAVTLGSALFVMVGAAGLIVATWMPATLRIAHGIEILADSVVYALALVVLLAAPRSERQAVASGPAV
jgi:hypothetical protein